MVESKRELDQIFYALSDSTRRSILEHVSKNEMSITQIAEHYKITYAAISKHIKVLEKANLVTKYRGGKKQMVIINTGTLAVAKAKVESYARIWADRFDNLEEILKEK
jgi:DNA-binding transcriptional ArsR family regulator